MKKDNASIGFVVKTIQSLDLTQLKGFSDNTVVSAGKPSERVITLTFAVFEPEQPKPESEPVKSE